MLKILNSAGCGITLAIFVVCQGCGGNKGTDTAPPADAAAAAPGGDAGGPMPSSFPAGGAEGGATASDAGFMLGGPGDNYRTDAGAGTANPGAMPGDALPGDIAGAGYGAGNYGASMAQAGAEGGVPAGGFPGDGGLGYGGPGDGQMAVKDPAPPEDADFLTKAKYAFAIGKEAAAHQYLYAHILCNDAEAGGLLKQFRWLPSGPKPSATTRFAAGVILEAPPNLTDLKPIGSAQWNNAGGGGGEAGMGSAPQGKAGANRTFQDLTGDFGQAVVTAFETRWTAGDFGTIFNEVAPITPLVRGPGGFSGMDGGPGSAMAGPGMEAGGSFGPGGGAPSMQTKTVAGRSITPGLLFLGSGSEGELMMKAEKEAINAVFLFDVKVTTVRQTGIVQNDTRLRLVPVGGKSIGATQVLNNVKIERAQMTGGNNDVEKNVTVLFKKLDTPAAPNLGLKLTDLPAIKSEHAKARIGKVIASKPKDLLAALTEFRLYHSLGLITDAEKSQAFQLALDGSDGEVLATGAEEDRQAILKAKLPAYK